MPLSEDAEAFEEAGGPLSQTGRGPLRRVEATARSPSRRQGPRPLRGARRLSAPAGPPGPGDPGLVREAAP